MGSSRQLVVLLDIACISDWCSTDVFSVFRQTVEGPDTRCRIGPGYMRAIGCLVASRGT